MADRAVDRVTRARPSWSAWGMAGLALLVVVAVGSFAADRHDRIIPVRVECAGDRCSAVVGDGLPITVESTDRPGSTRVGLYLYHHHEDRRPQFLKSYRVETALGPADVVPLTEPEDLRRFGGTTGWRIDGRRGLTHLGEPGERAIVMDDARRGADVAVEIELHAGTDAGVMVRASGVDDGLVLAVRPRYNDAFFFRLREGRPDGILALAPLRELSVGRESLRLGGLVARIVLISIAVLFVLGPRLQRVPRRPARMDSAVRNAARQPRRALMALLFVVPAAAMSGVALWGLDGVPHLADETAYVFQAKIFASGRLWAPAPPAAEFFLHEHVIIADGTWFAKYPPLFPALLALGFLVGLPWLVNPLLGAATAVAVFVLTRQLSDWRWGLAAWGLTVSSPFVLILGASLMSHMTAALFVTLSLIGVFRWRDSGRIRDAAFGGLCLGITFLARPYTALVIGLCLGGFVLGRSLLGRRPRIAALAPALAFALCVLPGVAIYLGWATLHAPPDGGASELYSTYHESDTLGFGPDKGRGWLKTWGSWGHTPAKALRSVHGYLDSTATYLLGWPAGLSLLLVIAALARPRLRRRAGLLIVPWFALVAGHTLYWATQHLGYGARYWFAGVPAVMALSALGLRELHRELDPARPWRRLALAGTVLAMIGCNLALYFPDKFAELHQYAGIRADLSRAVRDLPPEASIIFVKTEGLLYNDGFFMNDPLLRQPTIFARDLGPRNAELLETFPAHRPYRWDGTTLAPMPSLLTRAIAAPDGTTRKARP